MKLKPSPADSQGGGEIGGVSIVDGQSPSLTQLLEEHSESRMRPRNSDVSMRNLRAALTVWQGIEVILGKR
jgi:hypothetical protein